MSTRPDKRSHTAVVLTCFATFAILAAGCRPFPKVTSPESLKFLKQVYTACNTQNPARLGACQKRLEELVQTAMVTAAEQRAFQGIIHQAERGDWSAAKKAALRFAQDQIR